MPNPSKIKTTSSAAKPFPTLQYPLDWSQLTVAKLPALLGKGLELAKKRLKQLEILPLKEATYSNFIAQLTEFSRELDSAWGVANHLSSVVDSPAIRGLMEKYLPTITSFYAGIAVNENLWQRAKMAEKMAKRNPRSLTALQKRHLDLSIRGFKRSGADLKPKEKKEFVKIEKDICVLSESFSKKVLDATNAYQKDFPEDSEKTVLRGLPPSALEMGRAAAKEKGLNGYRFTLQTPSFSSIVTYAQDPVLRREFTLEGQKLCRHTPYKTEPLIQRILKLRQRTAQLLKFKNFATYTVETRMLNSPEKIFSFIGKLSRHSRKSVLEEFSRLVALKKDLGDTTPFEVWDRAYYVEKLTEKELQLETEALRPYFEFSRVLQSVFDLATKLFGVHFKKIHEHKSWHESVEYYEIYAKDNHLIGGFYTDFFPRGSKRSGAWMDGLLTGRPNSKGRLDPHVGLICGNFTPPNAKTPALLTHDEVITLYHEFGHLLHGLLTQVPIPTLAGTSVPRDFVELPSQLLENYCYDETYLPTFALHYKTGKPLEKKTIRQLRKSREFLMGLFVTRQLNFCTMDMFLHTQPKPPADIETTLKKVLQPYRLPYRTQPPEIWPAFGHLWGGGYAAGYYSYQWCNVLEADVWEYFEKHGILSPKTGKRYLETILSRGNSEPVGKLFKDFMGREPKLTAYLKRIRP